MDAYELITTRRSTRTFSSRPLEKEILEKLVEAGRYAPSGGNSQTTHFFVITDRKVLDQLAGICEQACAKMELYEGIYPSLASSIMR